MKKIVIYLILFVSASPDLKAQGKLDALISNLNQINQNNRELVKGQISDIIVDSVAKTIKIDNSVIPLDSYSVKYITVPHKGYKRNISVVMVTCQARSLCIINSRTQERFSDVGFAYKSKSICLQVIALLKKISSTVVH